MKGWQKGDEQNERMMKNEEIIRKEWKDEKMMRRNEKMTRIKWW